MKKYYTLVLVCLTFQLFAQSDALLYSRVKVLLSPDFTLQKLSQLGLETDHGQYAPMRFFINDFDQNEIQAIDQAGFAYEILIPDVKAYYLNPNRSEIAARGPAGCSDQTLPGAEYETPENFSLGSMMGFYTYQEMLDNLDAMRAQYPDLITAKAPIPIINTIEDRPIYWLRISDQADIDEIGEPEVLYTAVHHAREPNSMTQLIFYMWYLLENYATDPEVQFLVDNTEMYFIPCVNPDGYIYNEINDPQGGGLWRKNRRLNFDGSYGVDLNRNYGHEWGYDNIGSSDNPNFSTYRGTEPFSEPETKAVSGFCEAHQFSIALNYHTYGNLLIYPWGYNDTPTAEAQTFADMAEAMVRQNSFVAGTGSETVGYVTNGGSDDWMYGAEGIYAMTPEVGQGGDEGGFWPVTEDIEPNCKATMLMNLTAANLVHNYGIIKEKNAIVLTSTEGEFAYELKRVGLKDGSLKVTLAPLSSNIASVGMANSYDLSPNEQVEESITYSLDPNIQDGEEVVFLLSVNNNAYIHTDTIRKIYDTQQPLFYDPVTNGDNWQTSQGSWALTDEDYYTPGLSYADSPYGNYTSDAYNLMEQANQIALGDFERVVLNFWTKWDIEPDYDYAQVLIAINNGAYIPLCGQYTVRGTTYQDPDNPVYEGKQEQWVEESIDLTELLEPGDAFRIAFLLASDGYLELDGYYFDDLSLRVFQEVPSATAPVLDEEVLLSQNQPNPAGTFTTININTSGLNYERGELVIANALGQVVYRTPVASGTRQSLNIATENWPEGVYYYRLRMDGQWSDARKMVR